jgi:tripartite-type tricarboxylate transporter receptor subunit TctC
MTSSRLRILAAICATLVTHRACAESWPAKPLRVIVPFGAGTTTDIVPRLVFEQVSKQIGQPIVIENRPGAGGTTGSGVVARSDPDGYTVLVNSSAHTIAPSLYPAMGYSVRSDFASVTPLGIVPSVLLASPKYTAASDLVTAGKAKQGSLTFASVGVGTATYLSAVRFNTSAGVQSVHVPFKTAPEILGEMVAGRIDYFLAPIAVALPFVRDGKLNALAVNAPARLASLPDVPTLAESGFADAEYPFWIGVFVPAKTPLAVVERLAHEIRKATLAPDVQNKLTALGVGPMDMNSHTFSAFVNTQVGADAALVRSVGLKAE